jgi:hypothetical protein
VSWSINTLILLEAFAAMIWLGYTWHLRMNGGDGERNLTHQASPPT